jgi:metal-responsive CopG/Arc/MetJ family transcriptional regulator
MPRITATFSISLPPEMARKIEATCRNEHRTRSELVREALRAYLLEAEMRAIRIRMARVPEAEPAEDEIAAIRATDADFRHGRFRVLKSGSRGIQRPSVQQRGKRA